MCVVMILLLKQYLTVLIKIMIKICKLRSDIYRFIGVKKLLLWTLLMV